MLELVDTALRKLGIPKLSDHAQEVVKYHAVPFLFARQNAILARDAGLHKWIHATAPMEFDRPEWQNLSPQMIVDIALDKERKAINGLIRLLEMAFYGQCGKYKNRKGWRAHILLPFWMRRTGPFRSPQQRFTYISHIDCVFRFERLKPLKPVSKISA